jgi:hypothetical protein
MRTPLLEQPDCYREGGGGLGSVFKGALSAITLGGSDLLLGGLEAKMPDAPTQPESIQTGQQVAQKAGGSFDEEADAKSKARQTARKGTSKFRIPLANTKAGASVGGGTGLKI